MDSYDFEYIAPQSGVLELSTCGIENAYFLYGFDLYSECLDELNVTYNYDCDLDEIYDWFTQNYSMSKGETLTVTTPSRNHDAYDFNASFTPDQGAVCENPLTLVVGVNEYEHTGGTRYYQFIAPADGKLEAGTCGTDEGEQEGKFSIWEACTATKLAQGNGYDYDPDEYYWEYVMYGNIISGQEYILKINPDWTASDYSFTVDFTEVEVPGTSCNTPFDLNEGHPIDGNGYVEFTVDNSAKNQFYEYTASQKGTVRLSSCYASSDTYLRVYESNCSNLIYEAYNFSDCASGTQFTYNVANGQKFMFEWSNQKEGGQFDARLYFHSNVAGENCDQPRELAEGTNSHNNWFGSQYFNFTATLDGTLNLNTCDGQSDVSIDVLDACDGTLLATSDNFFCPNDINFDEGWAFLDYSITLSRIA